jgi:2,3-bisphosphoglycerate-dependent phosphoglycerate mutase
VPDLRERELGDGAVEDFLEAADATWTDPSSAHQRGESNAAAQQRGIAVVRGLWKQHRTEHIVLSTPGTLLALILQHSDSSVDLAFWTSLTMPDIQNLVCLRMAR